MNSTSMSRTVWASAGLTVAVLCSGCASAGGGHWWNWWAKDSASRSAAASTSQSNIAAAPQAPQQPGIIQPPSAYAAAPAGAGGGQYGVNPASTYLAGPAWSSNGGTNYPAPADSGCSGGGCGGCCRGSCGLNPGSSYTAAPATPTNDGAAASNRFALLDQPSSAMPYGGQKTCPVTGAPLGSMGPPVPVTYNGKTIWLCCQGCVEKFNTNASVYADLAALETSPGRSYASTSSPSYSCSGSGCSSGCCSRR
jgi:hypothetical protein